MDGYWVKAGWRIFIESQLGRKLTNREWKKLRYHVIYVVATEEKVVLDFEITNIMPSSHFPHPCRHNFYHYSESIDA